MTTVSKKHSFLTTSLPISSSVVGLSILAMAVLNMFLPPLFQYSSGYEFGTTWAATGIMLLVGVLVMVVSVVRERHTAINVVNTRWFLPLLSVISLFLGVALLGLSGYPSTSLTVVRHMTDVSAWLLASPFIAFATFFGSLSLKPWGEQGRLRRSLLLVSSLLGGLLMLLPSLSSILRAAGV